ncbi:MAG: hypothetical protein KGO21_06860 [Hyphomicrobiales bacterium]|nr:hypothetical protein [Hyphomicrobiales bacterium]
MTQSLDEILEILREAINTRKQVTGMSNNYYREFCPHVLGRKGNAWHVHVWQFAGESERGGIPDWRCYDLANLYQLKLRDGDWQRGHTKGLGSQTCVKIIDTVVAPEFAAVIRSY